MRIARALALAGIASRRKSEEFIRNGAVTVNGEVVSDLGRQVDLDRDAIAFRGRLLQTRKFVYYILHKPVGYTTTADDNHAKKTVFELLPRSFVKASRQPKARRTRVFPVGRLDRDTTGLLLFTNDGELANRLMHPRYRVPKSYEVRLNQAFDEKDRGKLRRGIRLAEGIVRIDKLKVLSNRVLALTLYEGKKREIRRIFEKLGYEVVKLKRFSLGPLTLGRLPEGAGRMLSRDEIETLHSLTPSV